MVRRYLLLSPGPTPVPQEVLLEGAKETIHHRTPEFVNLLKETLELTKYVFQTQHPVYVLSSSGTGGMETAMVNLVNPGEKAIIVNAGKFGERWVDIAKAYGIVPVEIKLPWGTAVTPEMIEKALKENPDVKVVFTTYSETSTGTVIDLEGIAKLTKGTDVILVTDAVSGLLAEPLKMDEWGIDVAVSGAQKGWMLPPGLAFIAVNDKAYAKIEKCTNSRYYFDLRKYKKSAPDNPWTTAVNLIYMLNKAVKMLKEEGIENVWARHKLYGEATRAAIKEIGLELFSERPGNVLTAVKSPIPSSNLTKVMRDKYGVTQQQGKSR